jgi:hypothetical protein
MRVRLSSLIALLSLPVLTVPAWAENQTGVDEVDFAGKDMTITFHLSVEQGAATNALR